MSHDTADLAAMIGSRICHDLISPIGAISNGLELMSLGAASGLGPEFELISESCANASARIRFFRVAFGSSPGAQQMGRADIIRILDDLGENRVAFHWSPTEPLDRGAVQLAFLALLCFETALPFGGEIRFDRTANRWQITARSDRISRENGPWSLFENRDLTVEITPSRVEFALLAQLTRNAGLHVTLTQGTDQISMTIA